MMDVKQLIVEVFGPNMPESQLKLYIDNAKEAMGTLTEREQCVLEKYYSGKKIREIAPRVIGDYKNMDNPLIARIGVTDQAVSLTLITARKKLSSPNRQKIFSGNATADDFDPYTFMGLFDIGYKRPDSPYHGKNVYGRRIKRIPSDLPFRTKELTTLGLFGISSRDDLAKRTNEDIAALPGLSQESRVRICRFLRRLKEEMDMAPLEPGDTINLFCVVAKKCGCDWQVFEMGSFLNSAREFKQAHNRSFDVIHICKLMG